MLPAQRTMRAGSAFERAARVSGLAMQGSRRCPCLPHGKAGLPDIIPTGPLVMQGVYDA